MDEAVGHYRETTRTPKIDLWLRSDLTALVVYEWPGVAGETHRTTCRHEGTWRIRNGWIDLEYGQDHFVVMERDPSPIAPGGTSAPHLSGRHAFLSSEYLLGAVLTRVEDGSTQKTTANSSNKR